MDVGISSAVSASLYMNQAQTAEQAQMQVFKEALDTQAEQVTEVLASADTGAQPDLAKEGTVGTQVNTFA
ncbi:putative motility protein [Vreelandella neptunia]|uniref:Motility protein n=1 Tax=Vreelandella neptunia TaxID=115551 RepID=A0ABS9SAT2_9GAMM|nr:putative motility protein [Halomonas neptunia]MCH4813231.1 putative motility protein [Halomonas neptunia]